MKKALLVALVVGGLVLLGCGDDDNVTAPQDSFSASVTLTNAAGEPLPDYVVGLSSLAYPYPGQNSVPIVDIDATYTWPDYAGAVSVYAGIYKYWNDAVCQVVNTVYPPEHTSGCNIHWQGETAGDIRLPDGVYKLVLVLDAESEYVQDLEQVTSFYWYQCDGDAMFDPARPDMALTGVDGTASFGDITSLPGLYCVEAVPAGRGENGELTEYYIPSATSYVLVRSPQGEVRMAQREMTTKANAFTLVWEELTPTE